MRSNQVGKFLKQKLHGKIDRIGLTGTNLAFQDADGKAEANRKLDATDHKSAAHFLIDWLVKQNGFNSIQAVGHRMVHGMKHIEPEIVTKDLSQRLLGVKNVNSL